jgi:uncharacterized protein YdaU (DUF1376 family)
MRFHVGDYLADTMHLSTYQHGMYVLLIMHYFKRGELPDDERALARITKTEVMNFRRYGGPVMALFQRAENGTSRHTRIDAERERARELSETRRNAGKQGANQRWGMANANDGDGKSHSPARPRARDSHHHIPKSPPVPPAQRGGAAADLNDGGKREAGPNPRAARAPPEPRNAWVSKAAEMMEERAHEEADAPEDGARVVDLARHLDRR